MKQAAPVPGKTAGRAGQQYQRIGQYIIGDSWRWHDLLRLRRQDLAVVLDIVFPIH